MAEFMLITILAFLSLGGGIILYLKLKYVKHSRIMFVSMTFMRPAERRAFTIACLLLIAGVILAIVSPTKLGL